MPGADEIVLSPGTYRLDLVAADEDAAASGDLDVTDELIVRSSTGNPADVTIDASMLDQDGSGDGFGDRVFDAHITILTLDGLTITGGNVDGDGGGVRGQLSERLRLNNVVVEGNSASMAGGGIFAANTLMDVVGDSRIKNNQSGSQGGGIGGRDSAVTVSTATISNNTAATTAAASGWWPRREPR